MRTETKLLGGILIASLVLIIGAVLFLGKGSNPTTTSNTTVNIDYSKGQKIGKEGAKVKLVEFSDLQCPACKAAESAVKGVIEKNKNNNFQFIYRHFPLTQHIHSKKAANFAEYAATQGKFWEIHDKLFETQEAWSTLSDPSDFFADLGSQIGLDKDKIKEAISKNTFDQKINDDLTDGNVAGVDATPTFYLNGKKLKLQNFNELDNAISQELTR